MHEWKSERRKRTSADPCREVRSHDDDIPDELSSGARA